jgi:hypothetical protein
MKPVLLKRGVFTVLAVALVLVSWRVERWAVCYSLGEQDSVLFCLAKARQDTAYCAGISSGPIRAQCDGLNP